MKEVAHKAYGIDKDAENSDSYRKLNFDEMENEILPYEWKVNLIICGELIEHLINPGHFLKSLKEFRCPIIITIPNAFSRGGYQSVEKGIEIVNKDHCAWYSWKTATVLFDKCGYMVREFFWYNGNPNTAEGMIFIIEAKDGLSQKEPAQ
jgi:hypothetical protein